ncbi:MAG: hypothetical protein ACFFDK_01530 [Promethearchaeota archaeon]
MTEEIKKKETGSLIEDQNTEKLNWNLLLSFFNQRKGPDVLFKGLDSNSIEELELDAILQNLDYNFEEETFIFGFRKNLILNYLFNIYSEFARSKQNLLMISYIIREEYIHEQNIDTLRLLENKKHILKKFGEELKNMDNLPTMIRKIEDPGCDIPDSMFNEYRDEFYQLYKKYYEKFEPISEVLKKLKITCPICKTSKEIDIPGRIVNFKKDLITIPIPQHRVCEHAFLMCLKIVDDQIKIGGVKELEHKREYVAPEFRFRFREKDIVEIKSYLKSETLINVLNALFFRKKVLILTRNSDDFNKIILKFINLIFQDSFAISIEVKKRSIIDKNPVLFEDYFIIENLNEEAINSENLFYEIKIVENFYNNNDYLLSLDNLKHEISFIYGLSQEIYKFAINENKTHPIKRKNLIQNLLDTFLIEVNKSFLSFLLKIVENYFDTRIEFTQDLLAKKIDEMWGN